jgi:pimeloyl-CoA synthetase
MKRYISAAIKDITQEDINFRGRVAWNICTDRRVLRHLAENDPDSGVRKSAQDTLDSIAWGEDFLKKTNIDPDVLDAIAMSSGCHLRYYVALHQDTSDSTLMSLAKDSVAEVREAALSNLRSRGL